MVNHSICITNLTVAYRSDGPGVTIICYITICICSNETDVTLINDLLTFLLTTLVVDTSIALSETVCVENNNISLSGLRF